MVRRAVRVIVVVVACILVTPACTASPSAGTPPSTAPPAPASAVPDVPVGGIDPDTRFTPLTATTLTTPSPVTGTDGKTHLAYELVLTNPSPATVQLAELQVIDAGSKQAVLTLAGPQLVASSNLLGGAVPEGGPDGEEPAEAEGVSEPSAQASSIPGSATAIVWLDVVVDGAPPAALRHRLVTSILRPGGPPVSIDATTNPIAVNPEPAVVLGPPLRGGEWYASDGCCVDDTHHRRGVAPINGELLVAQRFAVDWYLLDDQHRTRVGDPSQITSYLTYDKPAIAVADGVVVDALDGLPDTTSLPEPPPIPPITETVGNHVTLMIAPGVYALYAHFKPGSVAVQRGQQVKRGDVLGNIGSSGNSTTPHLHFQLMTEGTFFPTDSQPFAFECFELVGQVTERIWDDVIGLQPTDVLPYVPATNPGRRTNQMPLDRNTVTFAC